MLGTNNVDFFPPTHKHGSRTGIPQPVTKGGQINARKLRNEPTNITSPYVVVPAFTSVKANQPATQNSRQKNHGSSRSLSYYEKPHPFLRDDITELSTTSCYGDSQPAIQPENNTLPPLTTPQLIPTVTPSTANELTARGKRQTTHGSFQITVV